MAGQCFRVGSFILNTAGRRYSSGCYLSTLCFSRRNWTKLHQHYSLFKNTDLISNISNQVKTNSRLLCNLTANIRPYPQPNNNIQHTLKYGATHRTVITQNFSNHLQSGRITCHFLGANLLSQIYTNILSTERTFLRTNYFFSKNNLDISPQNHTALAHLTNPPKNALDLTNRCFVFRFGPPLQSSSYGGMY